MTFQPTETTHPQTPTDDAWQVIKPLPGHKPIYDWMPAHNAPNGRELRAVYCTACDTDNYPEGCHDDDPDQEGTNQ